MSDPNTFGKRLRSEVNSRDEQDQLIIQQIQDQDKLYQDREALLPAIAEQLRSDIKEFADLMREKGISAPTRVVTGYEHTVTSKKGRFFKVVDIIDKSPVISRIWVLSVDELRDTKHYYWSKESENGHTIIQHQKGVAVDEGGNIIRFVGAISSNNYSQFAKEETGEWHKATNPKLQFPLIYDGVASNTEIVRRSDIDPSIADIDAQPLVGVYRDRMIEFVAGLTSWIS